MMKQKSILDKNSLKTLSPFEIFYYLRNLGWNKKFEIAKKGVIYSKDDNKEVVVPLLTSFQDYAQRIYDVLNILESEEKRSMVQIFYDIKHATSDVIRLRIIHNGTDDGEIPIEGISRLSDGARELLAAAAHAVEQKKAFYPRRTNSVNDFLKSVKIGQTELGSYIYKIICPIPPSLSTEENVDEPFERKVTKTLIQSLSACNEASERVVIDGNTSKFEENIQNGISSNLLEAIVKVGEIFEKNDVEVGINWASARPATINTNNKILFKKDSIPVIKEAARVLKATLQHDNYELIGYVQRLQKDDENKKVIIYGQVDSEYRSVKLTLNDNDYRLAYEAHNIDKPKLMKCIGELKKDGRSYELINPREIDLIDVSDEQES